LIGISFTTIGSSDNTLQILAQHPRVELNRFLRADPDSFVRSEQTLSNQCWKESRGHADWVIVTDIDEHLFHPAITKYLSDAAVAGVTLIPALGFQMITNDLPQEKEILSQRYLNGAPWSNMMKCSIFDPLRINEINYSEGRHVADPYGHLCLPERDVLLLLHYKYLNLIRTHKRHQVLKDRLGSTDLQNGWGHKYLWSLNQLQEDWRDTLERAVDIRDFLGPRAANYPLRKWWKNIGRNGRADRFWRVFSPLAASSLSVYQ